MHMVWFRCDLNMLISVHVIDRGVNKVHFGNEKNKGVSRTSIGVIKENTEDVLNHWLVAQVPSCRNKKYMEHLKYESGF